MEAPLVNNSFDADNDTRGSDRVCQPIFPLYVSSWIVVGAGLPLTVAAIYFLVRNNQVISVFIINLFVSDLMQFLTMIGRNLTSSCLIHDLPLVLFYYYLMVSVGFMVCVSMERYLTVAWPLWYRFHRSKRSFVCVCVLVWLFPALVFLPVYFTHPRALDIVFGVFFLLPLPLFIFFLIGSVRALSATRSVPADEKRRIVAILVAVLLIYALLFVPCVLLCLVEETRYSDSFIILVFIALHISPLADLTLYILMRKDLINKQLASLCFCLREPANEEQELSGDGPTSGDGPAPRASPC